MTVYTERIKAFENGEHFFLIHLYKEAFHAFRKSAELGYEPAIEYLSLMQKSNLV